MTVVIPKVPHRANWMLRDASRLGASWHYDSARRITFDGAAAASAAADRACRGARPAAASTPAPAAVVPATLRGAPRWRASRDIELAPRQPDRAAPAAREIGRAAWRERV